MRLLLALLLSLPVFAQCPAGYLNTRTITVNSSQITGTLSNFATVWLSTSFPSVQALLKTTGNGGQVTDANGYDIAFYTTGGSLLPFELVRNGQANTTYVPTTGAGEWWINNASIADGTQILLCFGNSGVTTYQGNDTGTWNSAYKGIWHMANGTSLVTVDSTGINTTTNHSTTAAAGQLDGGIALNGSQYVDLGNNAAINTATFTYSAWVNPSAIGAVQTVVGGSTQANTPQIHLAASGKFDLLKQDTAIIGTSSGTINAGVWSHVAVTYDSSGNFVFYINGAASGSGTNLQTFTFASLWFGGRFLSAGPGFTEMWNGSLDELHISNVVRAAAWIQAEFNNQNAPATFYAVSGTPTAVHHRIIIE